MLTRRQALTATAAVLITRPGWTADQLDVAYINGTVWTGATGAARTDAIGTVGAKIAALGGGAVKAATGKRTRIVDLGGAFVMPGFIDNHTHFLRAALMLSQASLRTAKTPAELTKRIGDAAAGLKPGQWLQGGNWDAELWGGELPTRHWIDAVTPNTPVAVVRLDQHALLLNSLALKLAGIDRNTPDPVGGVIVRDEKGEPTGILKDRAKPLVQRIIPVPSDDDTETAMRKGIARGLSLGVAQVHTTELDWATHDILRRMRAKGETDIRFYSFVPLPDWERMNALVKAEGRGDDWVRWGGVKGLVDGSLGSKTALFRAAYNDAPDTRGITVVKMPDLRQWLLDADRAGLHITVHAIGDAANDDLLDMFADTVKANGERDRRFRIEHAQHLSPEAIPRFARQNVIASVQPFHAIDDGRWAINRLGPERLKGTYAFKSLMDAGACVTFGSDWPVAPIDPLTGVAAAVLRQTIDGANPSGWLPEQKVTVEQALVAYTRNNAYAGYQEDRLGVLKTGYIADLTVLDTDLLKADPAKITGAKVLRTIVNGVQRYGSET
ncbi:MAG: amidohydrolase [Rhodospirillaceae bacterium]|nr:amidohydrolase [Rhodospirillaceae bacterium]